MANVKENRKKWIAALRSGCYEQGAEALFRKGMYCCLGVLCRVYESETGDLLPEELRGFISDDEDLNDFPKVQEWVGLSHPKGRFESMRDVPAQHLTILNDYHDEYDFNKLADLIESEPEGLFL